MKKFLSILLAAMLIFSAQSFSQKALNVNGDEHNVKIMNTSDSAYHYIDSVLLATNEGGTIEVTVAGFAYDTAYSVTGKKIVRFNKRRGTLTLGTATDALATETDTPLGTSTWSIVASANKIFIRVKGKLNTRMRWACVVKRKSISN